ncbi:Leucyl/phenylalanyl-tRNA--protein transferase [hydrothermal vent metagenome]|uniref:Leucyl/phenylalanyl-tRNA--protein transferase n=1 Tax=hydrothermal vent metagenome TaxID=652676 RepID=A0A1W1CY96_9ZZZZ
MASMNEEESYCIPPLSKYDSNFPDPRLSSDEGLLAYGGNLSSHRLLAAYKKGIFPWYSEGDPILWWSPNPRLLLYPNKFKLRKSFRRVLRSGKFTVTFDKHFSEVIGHCATVYREGQEASWIVPEIIEAYTRLHEEGFGHSVEVHHDGKLVGGLYGIAFGKAFFGESMFSLVSDASKVAFKALSDVLGDRGYDFIDCQMKTDHMIGLGAEVVDRDIFLDALEIAIEKATDFGKWHKLKWEYKE